MKQEKKELLFKDICARLPYGIKVLADIDKTFDGGLIGIINRIQPYVGDKYPKLKGQYLLYLNGCLTPLTIDEVKPYLFPLSSITPEQERELSKLGVSYGEYVLHDDIRGLGIMVDEAYIFFEFCYKHHIDFLGLIEMGLANDATGLNIY